MAAAHALAGDDIRACRAALDLYGGELLPYDLAWTWTNVWRREASERRIALLSHASSLLHSAGDIRGAIPLLIALLAVDPCNERAARLLMECYHAEDERAEAARVYHTLRARLQEELRVLPGRRTEELYAAIRHSSSSTEPRANAQPTVTTVPAAGAGAAAPAAARATPHGRARRSLHAC